MSCQRKQFCQRMFLHNRTQETVPIQDSNTTKAALEIVNDLLTNVNLGDGSVLDSSISLDAFRITSKVVTSVKESDNDTEISSDVVVGVLQTANTLFVAQLANKICGEQPVLNVAKVTQQTIEIENTRILKC